VYCKRTATSGAIRKLLYVPVCSVGRRYFYVITAVNNFGDSGPSNDDFLELRKVVTT